MSMYDQDDPRDWRTGRRLGHFPVPCPHAVTESTRLATYCLDCGQAVIAPPQPPVVNPAPRSR